MKLFIASLAMISSSAFACWNMKGTLSFNDRKIEIDQKIDHDKIYSFGSDNYIFHIKVPTKFDAPPHIKDQTGIHMIEMTVQKKEGIKLTDVSNGKVLVKTGNEATMTKQDNKTGEFTAMTVKLTEI